MSSKACPVAPVFFVTMSKPSSTVLNAAIDAPPSAVRGAVTFFVRLVPTSFIFPPICFNWLDNAVNLALPTFANCPRKVFNLDSVVTISRCSSLYSCEFLSTFLASSFFCVSFNAFKRSSVSFTLLVSNFCFCCHRVTLVGLNFKPLLTCLNSLSMLLTDVSIVFNAFSNGAVSPRNSIVTPLMFPPIQPPTRKRRLYLFASPFSFCLSSFLPSPLLSCGRCML